MGIVENIKDAADLAKKVGDIELYRKIVRLEGEVMDLTREKHDTSDLVRPRNRTGNGIRDSIMPTLYL